MNLKNPDLDLIGRIHPERGFYGFMIRFWIAQKTQNTFLDSEIHIWIFPKKRTLRVDIQIKSFYLSVHVVVELSSNIMRGNWGFRWWPKNALLWQITSNQNLVGMDQAVDTLRNTVSIPEGHVWSLA